MRRFALTLPALLLAAAVAAADTPDPLRLVSDQAGIVLKVENPRAVVERTAKLDAYRNLQQIPQVRELLDSTQVRRFFQVVAYLEREVGVPWPELLDKLAGGGIALGVAIGKDPAPALLVVQGTDPAAVEKAYTLLAAGIEDQAGRDAAKPELRKATFRGVETLHVGKDAHLARVGAVVLFSNKEAALHEGLKRATAAAGEKLPTVLDKPTLAAAKKLAGDGAAAWGWLDFAQVKETTEGKNFFETTRKDAFQTLAFGSTADALRRSDFVAVGLHQTDRGFTLAVRLPAKRADLDNVMRLHVPPAGQPGSRPLLTPPGVIYSQSFYLDLAHLWAERKAVFNEQNLKDVEKAEKDGSKLLPGTTIGKLLEQSGPYHRLVAAHTGERLYAAQPGQAIPPFAYVASMRDPAFGESMDGVLRAGALLAGFQTGWQMAEADHDGVKVVTYRFSEKTPPKFDDPQSLRFSFAPSFAVVGDSLVVGSTPGIVKALIPGLKKESKAAGSPAVWRAKVFAAGGADLMLANPEQAVTQTVLSQGVGLAEATKQMQEFAGWLKTVGTLGIGIDHAAEMYEFKIEWTMGK